MYDTGRENCFGRELVSFGLSFWKCQVSGHSDSSSEASGHLEQDTDLGIWSILYERAWCGDQFIVQLVLV